MRQEQKLRQYPGILPDDDPDIKVTYPEESTARPGVWAEIKSIARDITFAVVLAVLIVVFGVQPVRVEGTSMEPRLENDERIFVNKFIYNFQEIERGDIVVFWYPDDPSKSFIKRVIGLPGERVRIDHQGRLYINDRLIAEPYLSPDRNLRQQIPKEMEVKPHHYYVMGDNRDFSNDSREWGLVPEKYIYGRAMFRYWPVARFGPLD